MRTRFSNRRRRPAPRERIAETPRLHRGRDQSRRRPSRDRHAEDEAEEMPRRRRSRRYNREMAEARAERRALRSRRSERPRARMSAEEDEMLMDLNLDDILEVPEDEIEDAAEEAEGECPVGCIPEEKVDEALEEVEEAVEGEDEEEGEEEEEKEEKEAAVEAAPVETAKWAPMFSEADINRLDKTADVTLIPFLDQDDPTYVVLANTRPVGEIRMSDLTDVDDQDRYALFTAESFPKGIQQAVEQLGAGNVLNDLGMRYFAEMVTQRQADSAAKNQVQADMEEAFQSRLAELKQNFINNVLLAVEASNKDVLVRNPLREAVRSSFRAAGVPDAVTVDLFEDALEQAGADYFIAMVNKADEWLGFEKEAMAQIEQTIKTADHRRPQAEAEVYHAPVAPSVPARTMPPQQPQRQANTEWDRSEDRLRAVLRNAGTYNKGR